MTVFLFVGEAPSLKAQKKSWDWEDGHLAARQLFDALQACGVNPHQQWFTNISEGKVAQVLCTKALRVGWVIVGLGRKVQGELRRFGIPYLAMVHPAARGSIRKKERYAAHVREVLGPYLVPQISEKTTEHA